MSAPLNFVRVPNRKLSLWQSSMSKVVKSKLSKTTDKVLQNLVLQQPVIQAVASHVTMTFNGNPPSKDNLDLSDTQSRKTYLSHVVFEHANAVLEKNEARALYYEEEYRQYSDEDPNWYECEEVYGSYNYPDSPYSIQYHDYTSPDWGNNKLSYSVIGYTLPDDATVAIIGDWGTGLDDAQQLVADIVANHNPDVIVHLGDIYYSGTSDECSDNFQTILQGITQVPTFMLPGNHDYYDDGYGFYGMLANLNTGDTVQQPASYFCLRTTDGTWQFLGMDTGYNDSDPLNAINGTVTGPWLQTSEIAWHQDKLNNFSGTTILLSHHQLFSASAAINGELSTYAQLPYLNPFLYSVFAPFFQTKIAAWLWGHEHSFVMYQDGLFNLSKGRLIGCSAYEEVVGDDNTYSPVYPEIPYNIDPSTDQPVEVGTNTDTSGSTQIEYYNHAYAILDFSGRTSENNSVSISYYQYPSWGNQAPASPASSLLCSEVLTAPQPSTQAQVQYQSAVNIAFNATMYITASDDCIIPSFEDGYSYCPTMSPNGTPPLLNNQNLTAPVTLNIKNYNSNSDDGGINSGDTVQIITTEDHMYGYSHLSAINTIDGYYVYYGESDDPNNSWTITKVDLSNGTQILNGDIVCLVNNNLTSSNNDVKLYLTTYTSTLLNMGLTVTDAQGANICWSIYIQQSN